MNPDKPLSGSELKWKAAPDDKACSEAWTKIMRIAEEHCLILQAYGGVATLAIPEEQRKANIRLKVLRTHCRKE